MIKENADSEKQNNKRRNKEFGIYLTLGMSKRKIYDNSFL